MHGIPAFSGSEDGTTHKHIPYDSHHINLKVPSYTNEDIEPTHHNCLLGVTSSPNQTAEGQAEDTVERLMMLSVCIIKAHLQSGPNTSQIWCT